MKSIRTLLFFAGLAVCTAVSPAVAEQPGEQFTRPFGFPLVTTSVVAVRMELGFAPITETGHHENVVCYLWPTPEAVVTFMSQGEGLSGRFTMAWPRGTPPRECRAPVPSAARRLKLQVGGLHLGMSKSDFEAALGKLAPRPDGRVGATFERYEPIDRVAHPLATSDTLYIIIVVVGRFAEGRLVELEIWKTMST